MPAFLDFGDDDDADEVELKFEDCSSCKFRNRPRTCAGCDMGENFEEDEPEGVDALFRERSAW